MVVKWYYFTKSAQVSLFEFCDMSGACKIERQDRSVKRKAKVRTETYWEKNIKIKNDKAEGTCVGTNEWHVNKSHCVLVVMCINHGVTLWEEHPCKINTWLSQVSCDVITCPLSDEQAAAGCLNCCLFLPFYYYYYYNMVNRLDGNTSIEQWITTMWWISQPGCAFLAWQRKPVQSTHTDTVNTIYSSPLLVCTGLKNTRGKMKKFLKNWNHKTNQRWRDHLKKEQFQYAG